MKNQQICVLSYIFGYLSISTLLKITVRQNEQKTITNPKPSRTNTLDEWRCTAIRSGTWRQLLDIPRTEVGQWCPSMIFRPTYGGCSTTCPDRPSPKILWSIPYKLLSYKKLQTKTNDFSYSRKFQGD